jgi:hypothetical protein
MLKVETRFSTTYEEAPIFNGMLVSMLGVRMLNDKKVCHICIQCMTFIRKSQIPPLSLANKSVLRDEDHPPQLNGLTVVEEIIISAARSMCYMIKLRQKGGQYARKLKGNIISFMQASAGQQISFGIERLEETLQENLIVHLQSPFKPADLQDFNDLLKARRDTVRKAYQFLQGSSTLYGKFNITKEMLSNIPLDGVPDCILKNSMTSAHIQNENRNSARYSKTTNDMEQDIELAGESDDDLFTIDRSVVLDINQNSLPTKFIQLQHLKNLTSNGIHFH